MRSLDTSAERSEQGLELAYWGLRIGLGTGLLAAGVDKFFDKLTTWSMYVSPLAERLLPVSSETFLRVAGVFEALVGLAILTRFTRLGAAVMALWLLGIVANLAAAGSFWDLAMRDLQVALAAFALGRLAAWRAAHAPASRPAVAPRDPTSWADLPPGTRSST
jgi:uncharacterized membrane protein YphA (DoxX/SURF4 family)